MTAYRRHEIEVLTKSTLHVIDVMVYKEAVPKHMHLHCQGPPKYKGLNLRFTGTVCILNSHSRVFWWIIPSVPQGNDLLCQYLANLLILPHILWRVPPV